MPNTGIHSTLCITTCFQSEISRHSFEEISRGFKKISKSTKTTVIILNTIKSKGIKEFENDPIWHARKISEQDYKIGKKRLGIK